MNKTKAFTVIELTVVMILSSIVISITYLSFDILQKQYRDYRESNDKIAMISKLNSLLHTDFNNSEIIIKTDAGILTNYRTKQINYEFDFGFILRKEGEITDTFFVKVDELNTHYLKQGQLESERIIDELTFETKINNKMRVFHYRKIYGADILMNVDPVR